MPTYTLYTLTKGAGYIDANTPMNAQLRSIAVCHFPGAYMLFGMSMRSCLNGKLLETTIHVAG